MLRAAPESRTASWRSRSASILALAALAMTASSSEAGTTAEPSVTASMQCDRVMEPGRVKCSIEARANPGASIAWADVALVELPDFASALKGRIGPADATAKEPGVHRWAFGLVAKRAGDGDAKARVRLVVCAAAPSSVGAPADAAAPRCTSATVDVRATLHVG